MKEKKRSSKDFFDEIKASLKSALSTQFGQLFRSPTTAFVFGGIIIALSIVAGWIPDGLATIFFEKNKLQGFIMLIFALTVLFILIFLGYILRHSLEWVFEEYEPNPKKGLILFLSPLSEKKLPEKASPKEIFLEYFEKLKKENITLDKLEIKLINKQRSEAANKLGSWAMPTKAIQHHRKNLQKVIVLTSETSSEQFPLFKEFIEIIYPTLKGKIEEIEVKPKKENISLKNSFEDLEAVAEAVNKAYKELENEKIDARDVIIDVTGGQKSNSIAAAILTVLDNKEFQYISTVDYKLRAYDVRLK